MEYRLPVKVSKLRKIVDDLSRRGIEFDEDDAVIDLMLATDRGDVKPIRYYARRWKWSKSRVSRSMDRLKESVEEWRNFDNTPLQKWDNSGTTAGQQRDKKRAKQSINGVQRDTGGTTAGQQRDSIEHTTYLHTTNKAVSNETPCQNEQVVSTMTAEEIKDSWNDFAKKHSLPQVRQLTPKRKDWIRLRRDEIVPELDEIYAAILREPFLIGKLPGKDWRIDFDYLWRNADNYVRILEGGHWPRASSAYRNGHTKNGAQHHGRNARTYDGKNDPELAHLYRVDGIS